MKVKVEELTHAFLQHFCDFEKHIALTNHFHTDWEADILLVDLEGYSHEIEIKLSKADFKNDFKKAYKNHHTGQTFLKHDKISCGDYVCNHFSFLIPMGMVEAKDIPENCGIIEFYRNPDSWETEFFEIRKPAEIHKQPYWNLVDKEAFIRILARNLITKKFQLKGRSEELIFKLPDYSQK